VASRAHCPCERVTQNYVVGVVSGIARLSVLAPETPSQRLIYPGGWDKLSLDLLVLSTRSVAPGKGIKWTS
jgi:hypothetical protein